MSDWKRRIAVFLCMVMTLTTVFCMTPQQEVQAASNQMKFTWSIGTNWNYNQSTGKYSESKCPAAVVIGQEDLYIGDYVYAVQTGKAYKYYGYLSTQSGVTYASSNRNVIAVDQYGKLTVKKAGTATITLKFKGKSTKIKLTAVDGEVPATGYENAAATSAAQKLEKLYGTGITAKNRYELVNQIAKINRQTYFMGTSKINKDGMQYISNPICAHAAAIKSAVNEYTYSVANPLSTRSSKMFKINSISGQGTKATITLKSKVTADQLFGLACNTRKDYKSTIKKGNACQFKIKLKGNGKTLSATATAKVGSNKITIKTKKLTKGKTYVLQDCYYGGWLDSKEGGNKKISFKAK